MGAVERCSECGRLAHDYETATLEWFRIEGNLRIAEFGRDTEALRSLTAELEALELKRRMLRDAIAVHRCPVHPRTLAIPA